MPRTREPGRNRLLRLVVAFAFAQGAASMARPAVSYRALSLGAWGLPGSNAVESLGKSAPSV
ncbi:hypothetical protein [Streptomyces sp. NPDC058092]|uniref:hypothetical protein n=1 Tax=Streptomyces sp. NPDC058092 TaxID=3346336 RepID=UPI0036E33D1A